MDKREQFKIVELIVDAEFRVVQPTFLSGSELTNLSMNFELVDLTFAHKGAKPSISAPPGNSSEILMSCRKPSFISLESDHLQNVVDDIYIFDRFNFSRAKEMKSFSGKLLFPSSFTGDSKYYIFVTPKTGIELFIATDEISILQSIKK